MLGRADFEQIKPPHGLEVCLGDDELEVVWTSNQSNAFTLIGAGLLFLAATLFVPNPLMLVLALLPIILGLKELSWTSIILDRHALVIKGYPSMFAAEITHTIPARTIRQIFVVERSVGRYELHMILDNDRSRQISAESLGGDLNIDVARYLELAIESFLGLANQQVAGEVGLHPAYRALPSDPFPMAKVELGQDSKGIHAIPGQARATVVAPEGVEVSRDANGLAVSWRQKSWDGPGKFVAVASLVFMAALFFLVIAQGDIIALIACILGGFVLLAFLWPRMLPYLTRMEIRSDRHELTVRYHPSLFRKERRVAASAITQLYVVEHVRRDSAPMPGMRGRLLPMPLPPCVSYHLTYVGQGKQVLAELDSAHAALFLEHELEDFLGLDDRPLPGELATKYSS